MSAVPSLVVERTPHRRSPRYPINVALDVIALRSGVPENLPGRCTDLSESGVGAMVAGELASGQQLAVELRLPNVGVPVRARALVRYQGQLRCGFEFVALSVEQREMIRYWTHRVSGQPIENESDQSARIGPFPAAATLTAAQSSPRIRIRSRQFNLLLAALLLLAVVGWWQWQRSWHELEIGAEAAAEVPLRVSPETMEMRIVSKTEPSYPDEARRLGKQGLAVLDVVIAQDGTVRRLQPVSGDDLLVKSAADAVRLWKFEPYQLSGRAVEVQTTIAVEFRLH